MNHTSMKVILGKSHISAFVAAPKTVEVLGIVRLGMEFGLLALNKAGTYLRVNGSQFVELDRDAVQKAIHLAGLIDTRSSAAAALKPRCTPTVVIRKPRRVACRPSGFASAITV